MTEWFCMRRESSKCQVVSEKDGWWRLWPEVWVGMWDPRIAELPEPSSPPSLGSQWLFSPWFQQGSVAQGPGSTPALPALAAMPLADLGWVQPFSSWLLFLEAELTSVPEDAKHDQFSFFLCCLCIKYSSSRMGLSDVHLSLQVVPPSQWKCVLFINTGVGF